mmetsp:Transcript_44189/g.116690  ORF Transcript_44189/g.116690 Transcript_44189/m.116690 type:complete len:252 (-) Transcript_44189:166-921(-)
MGDEEYDDGDEEYDDFTQPYPDDSPAMPLAAAPLLEAQNNFDQQIATDVSGVHDVDREEEAPPLDDPSNLLPTQPGFSHFREPEPDRRRTSEDANIGMAASPLRSIATDGLGEPAAPLSPPTPLGQSIGHSSVGTDIDVNTEALIEETIERLSRVHGVQGVVIVDRDGLIIRSTLATAMASRYGAYMLPLLERARQCAEVVDGPKSKLHMLCVRTRKHEMLMCAEPSALFSILILQDPNDGSTPAVLREPR